MFRYIKVATLQILNYRFNAILKRIPAGFSVEINPQINMEIQETQSNQKRP